MISRRPRIILDDSPSSGERHDARSGFWGCVCLKLIVVMGMLACPPSLRTPLCPAGQRGPADRQAGGGTREPGTPARPRASVAGALSPTETSCRWARRRSLPTQPPSWSVFPMGGTDGEYAW